LGIDVHDLIMRKV